MPFVSLRRLGRDPFVVGAAALCVLPLIFYAIPVVPMQAKGIFAGHLADPMFIALALPAVLLLILPLVILAVLIRLLPPWEAQQHGKGA